MHPKLWSWTVPHRREQLGRCVAHGRLLPAEVPRSGVVRENKWAGQTAPSRPDGAAEPGRGAGPAGNCPKTISGLSCKVRRCRLHYGSADLDLWGLGCPTPGANVDLQLVLQRSSRIKASLGHTAGALQSVCLVRLGARQAKVRDVAPVRIL